MSIKTPSRLISDNLSAESFVWYIYIWVYLSIPTLRKWSDHVKHITVKTTTISLYAAAHVAADFQCWFTVKHLKNKKKEYAV